jgi:hypothetical protein
LSQREGKEVEFHETPFDEPQVKGVDLSVNAAPPEKSFGTVVFDYPLSVTVKAIDPGGLDGKDVISIGADGAKAISQGEEATDVIGGGGDVLGGNPWWTTIGGGGCSLIIR